MRLSEEITALHRGVAKKVLYFIVRILLLILVTVPVAYSQATYSDVWFDDTNMNENENGGFIVGRGVTEVDYTYEDAVEVETTITSPNGRTATSYSFGTTSSQADAYLAWDENDVGDYFVNVTHYPLCYYDGAACGTDQVCPVISHGYNNGTLWWSYGYRRCSNPFTVTSVFPVRIARDAYELVSETWFGGRFGHGVCDYDATCYGYCSLTSFGVDKVNPQNCPRYTQCRTLVVAGRCLNIAKICVYSATRGVCSG